MRMRSFASRFWRHSCGQLKHGTLHSKWTVANEFGWTAVNYRLWGIVESLRATTHEILASSHCHSTHDVCDCLPPHRNQYQLTCTWRRSTLDLHVNHTNDPEPPGSYYTASPIPRYFLTKAGRDDEQTAAAYGLAGEAEGFTLEAATGGNHTASQTAPSLWQGRARWGWVAVVHNTECV